jgi:methylenetetrahydrofolate dehydrogenase (NADP+) / methenyltetrahydrofolate cyclohydrolase
MKRKTELKKSLKNSQSIKIFNGKKQAEKVLLFLKKKISQEKNKPGLAIILIGQDKASKLYVKLKIKAAQKIGLKTFFYYFKTTVNQQKVLDEIEKLNNDSKINGIIIQMPLPLKINVNEVLNKIKPEKDVDGFHQKSLFYSPLISAVSIALKESKIIPANKKIIALVNSDFFGQTLKDFFKKQNILINYISRKKVSSKDLIKKTKKADVIITVCGVPNLIKNDMIKKRVVLIDAGIVWPFNKKLTGDLDQEKVKEKACFLTPVPGGLGPLTVALLLKNVYLSFKKYGKYRSSNRSNIS